MQKYSLYNVYIGCAYMQSLKEALEQLDTINPEELYKLEAKVELYNTFFEGFGNTEEEKDAFENKRMEILEASKMEYFTYEEMVVDQMEKYKDSAEAEYLERVKNVDKRLKEGKEKGLMAMDYAKLKEKEKTIYPKTHFTKIGNLNVSGDYYCTDGGIKVFRKSDYVAVSQPITIKAIYREAGGLENMELEYFDDLTNEKKR